MFTCPASKVFPPPLMRMRSNVADSDLEPVEELTVLLSTTFPEEIHVLPLQLQIVTIPLQIDDEAELLVKINPVVTAVSPPRVLTSESYPVVSIPSVSPI